MLSSNDTQSVAAEVVIKVDHIPVEKPMEESEETRNGTAVGRTLVTNVMESNADVHKTFNTDTDTRVDESNELFQKRQRRHKIEGRLRTTLSELHHDVLIAIELLANGNEPAKIPDFLQQLVSEEKFLHLQILLINVGSLDVAYQVLTFSEICDQIHLRPITETADKSTKRQTLVLIVNKPCEAGKHLDRVRKWLPGYNVVEANTWDCPCCMEKTRQLKECNNCLEYTEAKNSYMRRNYGDVAVEECVVGAEDFNIKKCQSNCIKCRKIDKELKSKRLAVRNILNEYNALHKKALLQGLSEDSNALTPTQDCKKAMKVNEHIDNYRRTAMQRIYIL